MKSLTVRLANATRVRAKRDVRDASLVQRETFVTLVAHLRRDASVKSKFYARCDGTAREEKGGREGNEVEMRQRLQ